MKSLLLLPLILLTSIGVVQSRVGSNVTIVDDEIRALPVDRSPRFLDGDLRDFPRWILQHTSYPKSLAKRGIYGRVIVSFIVNSDGDVEEIKIERSAHKRLSKAVVKAVKRSPRWTPAEVCGESVNFRVVLPVTFE